MLSKLFLFYVSFYINLNYTNLKIICFNFTPLIFNNLVYEMKKYYVILGALQAFTALGAIPAGLGYLLDTSGKGMGVTTDMLSDSPLNSFLLPGLFLFIVNGFANVIGAYLSFRQNKIAGYTGLILGVALSLWIIIQVAWITLSSFLQPLYLAIGIINIFLSLRILKNKPRTNSITI